MSNASIYFKVVFNPLKDRVTVSLYRKEYNKPTQKVTSFRKEYNSSPWPTMDLMCEKTVHIRYWDSIETIKRKIQQARGFLYDAYTRNAVHNRSMEELCNELSEEFSVRDLK